MRNSLTKTQCFDTQNLYVRTGPECIFDPLIPIIQILQIPNDFRAEKDIKKIQSYLMNVNSEEISDSVSNLLNDISKNIFNEVVETSKEKEIGNIVNVKITDAKSFSLDGKIVK